ncbi:MAG: hypothetical protein U0235_27970 [Polyangiaceae bacterium]
MDGDLDERAVLATRLLIGIKERIDEERGGILAAAGTWRKRVSPVTSIAWSYSTSVPPTKSPPTASTQSPLDARNAVPVTLARPVTKMGPWKTRSCVERSPKTTSIAP